MVGAVDVDVATVGVASRTAVFARFKPAYAQDPAGNEVALLRIHTEERVVLNRLSTLKDHSFFAIPAYFVGQHM